MTNLLRSKIGRLINSAVHPFGVHVSRYPLNADHDISFEAMAKRLASRSIPISTVIDVGASNGCWSEKMRRVYPDANYLLIEANSVHQPALESYASKSIHTHFTLAAAGDRVGTIYFDNRDPFGGVASHEVSDNSAISVPCTTIDTEIEENRLPGPFLLKLDTHGFEIPIFAGASKVLHDTNLIIIETYNFNLTGECLRFWEMCEYLSRQGFLPLDIFEPLFRPKDQVFWQIDIVFARTDRVEFQSCTYD